MTDGEEKRITRQGIQGLFTFTPFKLLRTGIGDKSVYSLIIAEPAYMKVDPFIRWKSRSLKDSFRVPITESFSKKIVQPHELYTLNFTQDKSTRFIVRKPSDKLRDQNNWNFPPVYMEFSWNALNASHFCTLGWVATSAEAKCPLAKECPYFKPTKKTGDCVYYKGPLAYTSLYNVYPRVIRKFDDPLATFLFEAILAIRYEDQPLALMRFTDQGNFLAYIDGVTFSPKARWMRTPMLFLQEGIGFRIGNVNAIEFEFIPSALDQFIRNLLAKNKELARWIILKEQLFSNPDDAHIKERRGFDAFGALDQIVRQSIAGPQNATEKEKVDRIINKIKRADADDKTVEYATIVLLHSLAHTLKSELVAKYGCKGEDIGYHIDHPHLRTVGVPSKKIRLVIFETSMGGFGYLRNFVEQLRKDGSEPLEAMFKTSKDAFEKICENKSDKDLKNLAKVLNPYRDGYSQIIDGLIQAYTNSFPDTTLYPHINSVRRALTDLISIGNEARPLVDDFIERGPHCWDGCQLCVMFERECNFLPFDQPFLVSERLTKNALDVICSNLRDPVFFAPLKTGLRKEFETFLSAATNKIDLVTPWISPEIVDDLFSKHKEKQVKIRILTKEDKDNNTQVQSIQALTNIARKYAPNFEVRVVNQLHAKGMLVDDIMLLHGSFNFTYSGLESNVENVTISFSIHGARKFAGEFEGLWKTAKAL